MAKSNLKVIIKPYIGRELVNLDEPELISDVQYHQWITSQATYWAIAATQPSATKGTKAWAAWFGWQAAAINATQAAAPQRDAPTDDVENMSDAEYLAWLTAQADAPHQV
jgi:hypothetical protein